MPMERKYPVRLFTAGLCCTHTVHPDEGHAQCVTRTLKLPTNEITCFDSILIKNYIWDVMI